MFTKILIANRGEISCRVIETARRMGIQTVAIYSDADVTARHVRLADEAYRVGPAPAAESYLNIETIIDAALKSGAQAIHPGYGFLSESPDFVESVEAAGLVFIGPSAFSIRAMGLKDAAKTRMQKAGVPVVPGYHGEKGDVKTLASEAAKIGYPVLIKARAGGGGKGMRKVDRPEDFAEALKGAQREGLASFGDSRCLVEKWITSPRHIEIQIFGDNFGNVVHMFERDCSLQRRHQKVIEEAPAPGMTAEMRAIMGAAAVRCASSVNYSGAGTVEFIVDSADGLSPDKFWFMEMNTRLQVEHPVTEAVTGLDLVEWQLRIAAGEQLSLPQSSITLNGHAIETRIYSEDVANDYMPSIGKIEYLSLPKTGRTDFGVVEGDRVTPWYDPMIAKITNIGVDRAEAIRKTRLALNEFCIAGITTNRDFLYSILELHEFKSGEVHTGLIDENIRELVATGEQSNFAEIAFVIAAGFPFMDKHTGWSLWRPLKRMMVLESGSTVLHAELEILSLNSFAVAIGDKFTTFELYVVNKNTLEMRCNNRRVPVGYTYAGDDIYLFSQGSQERYHVSLNNYEAALVDAFNGSILSPMPGIIRDVRVVPGDHLTSGAVVVILEAMKMEHSLTAVANAKVEAVNCAVGEQVEAGVILVTLGEIDG